MMMSRDSEWRRAFAIVWLAASLLLSRGVLADENEGAGKLELIALSTRPDMVSGGDVLVQVKVPAATRLDQVVISLNGRNVTSAFRAGAVPGSLVGLVEGLALGRNTLTASSAGRGQRGAPTARMALVNHPITGPIFSGPQQQPFTCETQTFGLGAPLDANCSAPTKVQYLYRSTKTKTFLPLDPNAVHPSDLGSTTTTEGQTMPYIVRLETGTINRAVYQIAFLHEPGTPLPDPWTITPGWNRRLVYTFGGGCAAGYHQGRTIGQAAPAGTGGGPSGVPDDLWLGDYAISRGFAMASTSLNVFGTNCNDVISAESMAMVKEHFIKSFGVPRYTIGDGGSGGSMQQHMIVLNYPGLLDGILPLRSFPDSLTFQAPLTDCALLDRAFATSTLSWTLDQKTAVAGSRVYDYCRINGASWVAQTLVPRNCDTSLPASLVYNPITNPQGARCTLQDTLANVFGRDPQTGFGRRSLDNVGVQYGLVALNAGKITVDQFLDLNHRLGGFDIDGNIVPARTMGDLNAIRLAYQTGQLDNGGGGLPFVPMIDVRPYLDIAGNVHDSVRSPIMRARLIAENGSADNQVIVTAASIDPYGIGDITTPTSPFRTAVRDAFDAMDRWLANIVSDHSALSPADKVIANKPAGLVDMCYTLNLRKITDSAQCLQLFPHFGNPRLAAGEPLINDVLKCELKPVNRRDYAQPLVDAQFAQLKSIFPHGVCDYSRLGVEQQPLKDTWLSYPLHGDDEHEDEGHDD